MKQVLFQLIPDKYSCSLQDVQDLLKKKIGKRVLKIIRPAEILEEQID